ncbi:GNAT family N-acetyltransferase [Erythrobacter mangrovi]|uniref:GNAT family N-acetyltransferase n=1 Tax=Erythrobacter mangrovi TaxID=2739433 RepID=A0A7D4AT33_9SPHN|nr:GNAT family N-acetyltransferase [Erythrobacter mangrovi]QKG70637.1 GNAT family N-acetyltransferase [Erythrobacter mangrovi]
MISIARYPDDNAAVLEIWREYIGRTQTNLDFQNNDAEFARFPAGYELPDGCVLLARVGGAVSGCIAMRRHDETICEMKRLYVRSSARGLGLGGKLVSALIGQAHEAGYREMRLDVLEEFEHARALYERFGFEPAEPITNNPVPRTSFMGLQLA